MDQPRRAGVGGRFGDPSGAVDMDRRERPPARFGEDADEIDHEVGTARRGGDRGSVADVGGDRRDLADRAHRPEEARAFGTARRCDDARARLGEPLHYIAAQEARTAENSSLGHRHASFALNSAFPRDLARQARRAPAQSRGRDRRLDSAAGLA